LQIEAQEKPSPKKRRPIKNFNIRRVAAPGAQTVRGSAEMDFNNSTMTANDFTSPKGKKKMINSETTKHRRANSTLLTEEE